MLPVPRSGQAFHEYGIGAAFESRPDLFFFNFFSLSAAIREESYSPREEPVDDDDDSLQARRVYLFTAALRPLHFRCSEEGSALRKA